MVNTIIGLAEAETHIPAPRGKSDSTTMLRTPSGLVAAVLIVAILVLAVIAPYIWGDKAGAVHPAAALQGASSAHLAGTDNLGRDLFARILVATRKSVELALLATLISVVVGLLLGTAPAIVGRRLARFVVGVINIAIAFPALLLALFFAVVFGVGTTGAVLAIGFAGAPSVARLAQTLVAGVVDKDYIAAARIAGVRRSKLVFRHILPNIAEPIIVNATIGAGTALLSFAALSYLGLGVQPPNYDWGRLLNEGIENIYGHPSAALAPGIAIIVAGLAFNLFGEAAAKHVGQGSKHGTGRSSDTGRRRGLAATAQMPPTTDVLDVQNLSVTFPGEQGPVRPVRNVSLRIGRGETIGVVGESGSGKSMTALAIAGLIDEPGRVDADRLTFLGSDLRDGASRTHRHLLGSSLAMVFQDPMTSFNPTMRIGAQLAELSRQHGGLDRKKATSRAVDRLRAVRVPAAERRARQYPHEFSGGMRQRAMIAMGMMGDPALIIADEPTTALDVTVQRQVLRLLDSVRKENGVSILLISHDVTVVQQVCDRVLVMYAGRIVEEIAADELNTRAQHPYTRALIATVPDMHVDLHRPLPVIPGRPVDPTRVPSGCAFAPRCSLADDRCRAEDPPMTGQDASRVACWNAGVVPADPQPAAIDALRGADL